MPPVRPGKAERMDASGTGDDSNRKVRDPSNGVIRRTRLAMGLEAALRAFWPLAAFLAGLWAVLAFGLAELASRTELMAALGLAGAGALWLAYRGVRRFRLPSCADARARVDATLPPPPASTEP